jgi:hypothetical protein
VNFAVVPVAGVVGVSSLGSSDSLAQLANRIKKKRNKPASLKVGRIIMGLR